MMQSRDRGRPFPRKYTNEERMFLVSYYAGHTDAETAEEFSRRFGRRITRAAARMMAHVLGVRKSPRDRCGHLTRRQAEWLAKYAEGKTMRALTYRFNRRFGTRKSVANLANSMHLLGIRTGTHQGRYYAVGNVYTCKSTYKIVHRYKVANGMGHANWTVLPKEIYDNAPMAPNLIEAYVAVHMAEMDMRRMNKQKEAK